MIKTVLTHKIFEVCIDALFDRLTNNFPQTVENNKGRKLIDGYTYEFISFTQHHRGYPEVYHLYNAQVYRRRIVGDFSEMVKVIASTVIRTSYDKHWNTVGEYIHHNDDMYLCESWITDAR